MTEQVQSNPELIYALRRVTENAALAAYDWIGRGDKIEGNQAPVEAMHRAIMDLDIDGEIVIGEGERDQVAQLYKGEPVGNPDASFKVDLAVDPLEGTTYLAKGQTNALAVIAVAPRGTLLDPGPAFYMEKFAAPAAAVNKVDPEASTKDKLKALATALDKPLGALTIYVLEKPRHRDLLQEIHEAGARAALYPAGDVAGALLAAMPEAEIDALMGTGGTPEGVLSACAIRALGGEFLGRIDPQLQTEARAVSDAGMDTRRWYRRDEIVSSQSVFFCATGITTGLMLDGVSRTSDHYKIQTLMISGVTGERQVLTTYLTPEQAADMTAGRPQA